MRNTPLSLAVSLALAPIGLLATAAPVAAQDDPATLDVVEVTGSRLKRAEAEGATPVVVIDRAQIDASGDISVAELLRDSTVASAGNFRPQSGSSAQAMATVDLRGLGAGRTLVLIDGRRAPTSPMNASSGTDVNAIPLAAVERIEILSDGASAIYGSDAIGGVVNIVLRRDFNGAELRYGVGNARVEGGDLEDASVVFGASGERTRVIGGASASRRGMVFTRDQIGGDALGVSLYGNNYYNWDIGAESPVPGFDCTQGAFYVLGSGLCSFNFNAVAANEAAIAQKAAFVRADHQVSDDWSVYSTATVTRVESFGRYAPVPGVLVVDDGTPNDINGGVVCGAGCVGDGLPTYFFHRFAAAGNRDNVTDATNADFLLGVQGRIGEGLGVDVGLRRTDYKFIELGRGYIIASLANAAANSGDYLVTDPFGADPAVLASIQATTSREARWQADEVFATVDFDLFELGGGLSRAVVGGEYRREDYTDRYDSLSEGGQVLGSAGNSAGGARTARAAYFEWLLPFSRRFDLTLAGRLDDYNDYGSEFSPKLSLRWQPLDRLTVRASYGQGFRAPGLDILTQKPTFSAEPVTDPQTCAVLGQPGNCQLQVDTIFRANPDLAAETTVQYGLGVVADPFDWLNLSLDYYYIEIEDNIQEITGQDVINSDVDPLLFGPIPPGLGLTRNAAGRILVITAGYANRGTLRTDGLDLRAATRFDFGAAGRLDSELGATWVRRYELVDYQTPVDYAGLVGTPDLRAALLNTWTVGDFSVQWNLNYIAGQSDGAFGARVGGYATNDLQVAWRAPWNATISAGATNLGDRYPELVDYAGRPFNFYLYDAYGRTTYLRYTQRF